MTIIGADGWKVFWERVYGLDGLVVDGERVGRLFEQACRDYPAEADWITCGLAAATMDEIFVRMTDSIVRLTNRVARLVQGQAARDVTSAVLN